MQAAVLGDAGCGKTSLIRAIVGLDFDEDSPPTEQRTSYTAGLGNGKKEALVLIDCGPIEDEMALRSLLRGVNCVVLCYDCSSHQTFTSIKSVWLDAVRAACWEQNVSFVLVGCKADDPHREVVQSEVEAYAIEENIYFLETCAKTGTNIELLRSILLVRSKARAASKLKSPIQAYQPAQPVEQPTTLRIHRTGSVDLSSRVGGLNLHVTREGSVLPMESTMEHPLRNGHHDAATEVETFPLMVDVKMGGGNIGTIIVNSSRDDPLALADAFLRRHGLDVRRASELARVVRNRLDEYFATSVETRAEAPFTVPQIRSPMKSPAVVRSSPSVTRTSPAAARTSPAGIPRVSPGRVNNTPGAILARLNVILADGTATVVAVRQGDDANKLVEAWRRTYDLPRDDPVLQTLTQRISDVLRRGAPQDESEPITTTAQPQSQTESNQTLDLDKIENILKLSDAQKEMLLKALGISGTATSSTPSTPIVPRISPSRAESVKTSPRVDDQAGLNATMGRQRQPSFTSEEEEDGPIVPIAPTEIPSRPKSAGTKGTPVPPPPPPSKYIQKMSPVPFRTPQSPAAPRSVGTVSPTTTASRVSTTTAASTATSGTLRRTGRPLFYVDVNLGGKTDRIAVHKGDNLKEVAEAFLVANNLSKTKLLKLTQLLDYHFRLHQKNRKHGF